MLVNSTHRNGNQQSVELLQTRTTFFRRSPQSATLIGMAKIKEVLTYISLVVGIISGILAIIEKLTDWGMLNALYPFIDQGTLFWLLTGAALILVGAYIVGIIHSHKGFLFSVKGRPADLKSRQYYKTNHYDVLWREYPPTSKSHDEKAWIEGPYCPECKRELEEAATGTLRKKPVWTCPNCETEYEKPKGDPKDEVRKDFEAYLRRKGKL